MEFDNNIYDGFNDINQKELEAAEDFEGNEELIQGNIDNQIYDEKEKMLENDIEQLNYEQEYDMGQIDNININDNNELPNSNEKQILYPIVNSNDDYYQKKENNINNINDVNKLISNGNILEQKKLKDDINKDRLKQLREEIENITDSELDEPQNNHSSKNQEIFIDKNIKDNNLISDSPEIGNNKYFHDLEEENKLLKEEVSNKEEIINSKEKLNKEYQNLLSVFKDKNTQNELFKKNIKNQINDLNQKLKEKDLLINEYKKRINIIEKNFKSLPENYTRKINELQKNYEEKEKQNVVQYHQKEKKLTKDFMEEVNKYTNVIENLKIENEKLKYDLYSQKNENKNLHTKISELIYENKDILNIKNKEIKKLKEKIPLIEKELNEKNLQIKNDLNKSDNDIQKFKKENNTLIQQINQLNEKNKNYIFEIMEHKHNMEMLNNLIAQNEIELKNKDLVIEQLGNQINEMNAEIDERINDFQIHEENNQKEIMDYSNKIKELLKEKNMLEMQNEELSKNLAVANDTLKEYNDLIMNKYKNIEKELINEQEDKNNIIEEYNAKIQKIKIKYINLKKENNKLKEIIYKVKKDKITNNILTNNNISKSQYNSIISYGNFLRNKLNTEELTNVDNHMNKTMFDINYDINEAINGNPKINRKNIYMKENIFNKNLNSGINKVNLNENENYIIQSDRFSNSLNKNDEMIKEFKDFLKKMDEKIEKSNK